MSLFDKKAAGKTAAQVELSDNISRSAEIDQELLEIPLKLEMLEKNLAQAGLKERTPIFQLKNRRDSLMTEQSQLGTERLRIERIVSQEQELAGVAQVIKAAPKKIQLAEKDLSRLHDIKGKLGSRIASLRADADKSRAQALDDEQAAAKAYAAAMAADDQAAESTALSKLEQASAIAAAVQRKPATVMVTALEAELQSVEQAVTKAAELLQQHQAEQMRAVRVKLEAQWDEAARALIAIGASIVATSDFGAGHNGRFDSLNIPLTSRAGASEITRHALDRHASAITRDQLTAS